MERGDENPDDTSKGAERKLRPGEGEFPSRADSSARACMLVLQAEMLAGCCSRYPPHLYSLQTLPDPPRTQPASKQGPVYIFGKAPDLAKSCKRNIDMYRPDYDLCALPLLCSSHFGTNISTSTNMQPGVTGSVWATLQQQAAVPPIRSQLDIPPKSKASPQVTKTKKNKENKGKLSPPKCRKEKFDQDHKPLIGGEAVNEDPALLDQENLDPNSMPFELFKKKNKTKRAKDKEAEVAENEVTDIIAEPLTLAESKETSVLVEENVANQTSSSDEGLTEVGEMTMKEVKSEQLYNEIFESAEPKLDTENLIQETSLEDSPAVLPTDDITDPVTSTEEEGPQLSVEDAINAQPNKLEDVGVDGKGRERESLLRDHNPEGLVCCTIL
ncbi:hypothetical protein C0Q70_15720 [Pomacea canaliculata]|uniref:Uncharacterized protein n=1 Tax=Pomacea canaliculata TaxID=400727 RepID=A0A2T7NVM9_POMCA|nr:hypothetical protein C0Q70_15720 [Pomacea canaliculata]